MRLRREPGGGDCGATGTGLSACRARRGRGALGVPLSARRTRFDAAPAWRLRLGAGSSGGARGCSSSCGASKGWWSRRRWPSSARSTSPSTRVSRRRPRSFAGCFRRRCGCRGAAPQRTSLTRDRGMADDHPERTQVRSDAGAAPGAGAGGQLGIARRQPAKLGGREPAAPLHREAAVRIMGGAVRARRQARPALRPHGALRGGYRFAAGGVARA
jgi:hypothetical protein